MAGNKQSWGSRIGLILAMAGNAVGLGNFLRFPVQAIQNGGGAFMIPYIICFLIMGIPLLWIEWASGRFGGRFGHHATPFIFQRMGKNVFWKYSGVLGIFATTGVATYYCYIESWTLSYTFKSLFQTFSGMSQAEVVQYFSRYTAFKTYLLGLPGEAIFFFVICIAINTYILSKGIKRGIETMAKIAMPLLLLFGFILAIKALSLGSSGGYSGCSDCDSFLGLQFLWQPQFTSILDPKVWLAAAGQVFFTLSVGMGCIHSYASFVGEKEDIVLNSMASGWLNEFVEVVLGSFIVIPIACGYLGLEWVLKNAGFSTAFQTMPFLFGKWGTVLATIGGVCWFGLLFFAGITSSLAMCTPYMSFMQDEYKWSRRKSALAVGSIVLILGLPTVIFFNKGVFDEYDYWTGTVSLFVFALFESILFTWVFGIERGWEELHQGADLKIFPFYKYILKYLTPTILLIIFVGSFFNPKDNNWKSALTQGWEFDASSIIGKIKHSHIVYNRAYFSETLKSEYEGFITQIDTTESNYIVYLSEPSDVPEQLTTKVKLKIPREAEVTIQNQQFVAQGTTLAQGFFIHDIFYLDFSRGLLIAFLIYLCWLTHKAPSSRLKME